MCHRLRSLTVAAATATVLAACGNGSTTPHISAPFQQVLRPHLPYVMEFFNNTHATLTGVASGPQCMRSIPNEGRFHPRQTWEAMLRTSSGGRCLTRQSVFYIKFQGAYGGPIDVQFTKKVTSKWQARLSGARNPRVRFCWFADGIGGTGLLTTQPNCTL